MRKALTIATPFLVAAAAIIALAVPASAIAVTTAPRSVSESSEGQTSAMASSAGAQFTGIVAGRGSAAVPATLPSCRAITYRGNGGAIHVQTSPNGTVVWGIYMYDSELNAGPWTVDVYVGKRRVDHKSQNYPPHASVNPVDAKKGAIFRISATHYATANETGYHNVTNGCIIP